LASEMADADLPRSIIRRIVRTRLIEVSGKKDVQVNKDALSAFSESAKIFIHYLSATANEICHEHKRSTVSANDVLSALEELDFAEFIEPLNATLAVFREERNAKKKQKTTAAEKEQETVKPETAEIPEAAEDEVPEAEAAVDEAEAPVDEVE